MNGLQFSSQAFVLKPLLKDLLFQIDAQFAANYDGCNELYNFSQATKMFENVTGLRNFFHFKFISILNEKIVDLETEAETLFATSTDLPKYFRKAHRQLLSHSVVKDQNDR